MNSTSVALFFSKCSRLLQASKCSTIFKVSRMVIKNFNKCVLCIYDGESHISNISRCDLQHTYVSITNTKCTNCLNKNSNNTQCVDLNWILVVPPSVRTLLICYVSFLYAMICLITDKRYFESEPIIIIRVFLMWCK